MLAVSGGRLIALSSPWGRRGWYWQQWSEGGDAWRRWLVPSMDCPRIDASWLEGERARLPRYVFDQEYGASFLDADDQYFSSDVVERAISAAVTPRIYPDA
jgi:hypothetical protein